MCNNNTAINIQMFTSSYGIVSILLHVPTGLPLSFFTKICFFGRPAYLGLIMKNRVKSVFLSDKCISNLNVSNNIKITLHAVFTCAVAILELKKWGGHCGANGKSRGTI